MTQLTNNPDGWVSNVNNDQVFNVTKDFKTLVMVSYESFTQMYYATRYWYYRCDHNEIDESSYGEVYSQLKSFDQAYVVSIMDMSNAGCGVNCNAVPWGSTERCLSKEYCPKKRCASHYSCQKLEKPAYLCEKNDNGFRLFENFTNDNSLTCNTSIITIEDKRPDCELCICFCDDKTAQTHRVFNLKPQLANTEANEVIIGLKLKNDGSPVFSLHIEVGKLLSNNRIDESSVKWVPNSNPSVDYNHFFTNNYYIMRRNAPMDMDFLLLDADEVLTGNFF